MKLSTVLLSAFALNYADAGKGNRRKQNRQANSVECYKEAEYTGTTSSTQLGLKCANWQQTNKIANHLRYEISSNREKYINNYCRNPDNDPNGPWCYTTDYRTKYDYCMIQKCENTFVKDYSVKKIPNKNCLQKSPGDEKGIGSNYTGTKNSVIVSGKEIKCQNWNSLLPHRSMFLENEDHNYCRNPNNDPQGPWCYTTKANKKIAYCDIPSCQENKESSCGRPKIKPEFVGTKKPTNIRPQVKRNRQKRDEQHVQNGEVTFTDYDYGYVDEFDQSMQITGPKLFPKNQSPIPESDSTRIVGGKEAVQNSIPWQINIRYKGDESSFCGGSIIAPNRILTAAHCVMDEPTYRKDAHYGRGCYETRILEVQAGTHTKSGKSLRSDTHKQITGVKTFCMHPEWDQEEIYGDIAILILHSNLKFNEWVSPICLPQKSDYRRNDEYCMISGFGRTQGTADETKLNQQVLPVVENKRCNRLLNDVVPDLTQMCAGEMAGGVDTCQGDSGGPLSCLHQGTWVIDGITSWGYGCGNRNSPGVYTRVSHPKILNWIHSNLKIN